MIDSHDFGALYITGSWKVLMFLRLFFAVGVESSTILQARIQFSFFQYPYLLKSRSSADKDATK